MRHLRTGLAGTFSLLALVLVGCGQVATNTLSGDNADAAAVPPTITSQPASQSVPAGETAKFSVVATGSAPLAYQWRKNGSVIEGAVSDTYSSPATADDDGAVFSVVVSNPVGSVESAAAKLFVMPADVAPSITVQPADQSVTTGQAATFSVTATGSEPLSYQWQRNGAPISGATDSSYTAAAASNADDGALFTVIVSNPVGSITSHPARLGVSTASGGAVAPTITGQPADVSIKAGQIATFTVAASGTAPLVYQWTRNGVNIPGANAASYSTPPAAAADSGALFGVIIANNVGYVTSRGAKLTVSGAAPRITTQPADQTVAAGNTATFQVVATGTAPLTYHWHKNGVAIGGATSASFTTGSLTSADSGATYSVVVSNAAGTATSRAAKLTVSGTAPSITTQPLDQTVASGKSATFTVVAAGSAPLSYQWRRNGDGDCRGDFAELHHACARHRRQRQHVHGARQQLRRQRHQSRGQAHRHRRRERPDDHDATCGPEHSRRADRHLQRRGHRQRAAVLPVAPQRHDDCRCHQRQLHDARSQAAPGQRGHVLRR